MKNLLFTLTFCLIGLVCLKAQTLTCNQDVMISLDMNGEATLIPDMFVEGGAAGLNLEISLNHAIILNQVIIPAAGSLFVDCSYLGTYSIEVHDLDTGNKCWTQVFIEDIIGSCPTEFGPDTYSLHYDLKNSIAPIDTDVELNGTLVTQVYDNLDTIGVADLIPGENVLSFPSSNEQFPLLQLSAIDLLHLIKMFYETSVEFPLQAVVMDVDGSGYIGVNDIIEIRNNILGVTFGFSALDYLFVSETYEFDPNFDPFDFTDLNFREYKFDRDLVTAADLKFNVYKLGNIWEGQIFVVTDSINGGPTASVRGSRNLLIEDQDVIAGQVVDVPFSFIADGTEINVFQLGLQLEGLELMNVDAQYSSQVFDYNHISNDDLRFVFASPGEDDFEMSLRFEVQENGRLSDMISLNQNFEQSIANYDAQNEIELNFNAVSSTEELMILSSNVLEDRIIISLNEGHSAPVLVSDVKGRRLQSFSAQNSIIEIDRSLFTHPGIYFLSTVSNGIVSSKKIIVL